MSDFIQRAISRSEEICNQMDCPSCGKRHHVSFHVTRVEAVLTASFSEEACDEYRKQCRQILKDNLNLAKSEDIGFILRL